VAATGGYGCDVVRWFGYRDGTLEPPFQRTRLDTARPETATLAVFVSLGGAMADSAWGGKGRPRTDEAAARKARFLCAIADGSDAVQAAKDARLDPWRALRIVTECDYLDVVRAIRDGAGPVVAVVEPAEVKAA
jgi:hypothetical protein